MAKLLLLTWTLALFVATCVRATRVYAVGQQTREIFTMPESAQNWQTNLHAGYSAGSSGQNYAYVPGEGTSGYSSRYGQGGNSAHVRFVWGEPGSSATSGNDYAQNGKYASAAVSPFGQVAGYASPGTEYSPPSGKYSAGTAAVSDYGQPDTKYGSSGSSSSEYSPPSKYEGSSASSSEYQQPGSKFPASALSSNSDYSHLSKYAVVPGPASYSRQAGKGGGYAAENTQGAAVSPYSQSEGSSGYSNSYSPSRLTYSEGGERSGSNYEQEGNSQVAYAQPGQIRTPYSSAAASGEESHSGRHSTAELNPQESGRSTHSGPTSGAHGGWWDGWMKGWYDGYKYGGGKGFPNKG
ncbi:pro-resilin-like [Centruroides sculpturatus]|uniref:pro-resilin-like n=1 Tax=Centruroides sculpturatus TaxID=218467 RepID=UPI000C6D17C5|nr:pro-resilin-like [Centruroides sculpturatus]